MFLLMLDGEQYKAPLQQPANILDRGTGTGIWVLNFGSIHPNSHALGLDLAPNQAFWTFSNVEFHTNDLEQDWTFPEDYFDYIRTRMVGTRVKD